MENYDVLKLENQLCFPLYAAAKEVVRLYTPYLEEIDLTYTQYIVMMVVWENSEVTVKDLGERLYLDTGTLTPLLRKLEDKGYIQLQKSPADKRSVVVFVSDVGKQLKDKAVDIPAKIGSCLPLTEQELLRLYELSYKVLNSVKERERNGI